MLPSSASAATLSEPLFHLTLILKILQGPNIFKNFNRYEKWGKSLKRLKISKLK